MPQETLIVGRVSDVGSEPGRRASAILVTDGIITAIGGDDLVAAASRRGVPVLDYGDRYLSPGFVDPHAHFEVSAVANQTMIDCRAPRRRTVDDVVAALHAGLSTVDDGGWLMAQANLFFDQKLADRRFPTRQELDAVSRDVPIAVRAGGHTTILNSKAFELSGVEGYAGGTGMMGGAVVERDRNGELTGLIAELDNALPVNHPTDDEMAGILRAGAVELFTRFGVTTVGEISETRQGLLAAAKLAALEELPVRLSAFLWSPGVIEVDEACRWQDHFDISARSELFDIRGVKIFSDGGFSARNAATLTPYVRLEAAEPESYGKVSLEAAYLIDAIRRTRDAGLQLAVHANGERAQAFVCDAVLEAGVDPTLPVRLEHAGNYVTRRATTEAWAAAGIVPASQPAFLYNFGHFLPDYLGEPGRAGQFPYRALLDDGWTISGSSDTHLGAEDRQTNPLFGMWCSVTRKDFYGELIEPESAISLREAYRMHTIDAAAALGRDHEIGSLDVGKRADIAVLSEDPFNVDPDDLPSILVDSVLLGGAVIHQREGARPSLTQVAP